MAAINIAPSPIIDFSYKASSRRWAATKADASWPGAHRHLIAAASITSDEKAQARNGVAHRLGFRKFAAAAELGARHAAWLHRRNCCKPACSRIKPAIIAFYLCCCIFYSRCEMEIKPEVMRHDENIRGGKSQAVLARRRHDGASSCRSIVSTGLSHP